MAADLASELEGAMARINELMAEGQELAAEKARLERAAQDKELGMATAIAASLASSGYGSKSGNRDSGPKWKSTVKMPTFKKDGSEDFLLFYGRFEAWSALQDFDGHQQKLSLFMSFEGEAAAIARIFGPGTENFSKPYSDYTREIKELFSSRADSEAAKSQFESRVQNKDESAQTYGAHKLSMFMVAYPDTKDQSHLTREYIRGLSNPKVREEVVLHSGKTFPEVVAKSRDAEAAFAYLSTLGKTNRPHENLPVAPPKVTLNQEPMDLGSLNAILAAMQGMQRDKFGRFQGARDGCWECGDKTHIKRNCPTLPPLPAGRGGRGRGGWRGRGGRGRGGWGGRGGARNGTFGAMTVTEEQQQQQQQPQQQQQQQQQQQYQTPQQQFNPALGNF